MRALAATARRDPAEGPAQPGLRGRYLAVNQLAWTLGQALAPGLFTLLLGRGPAWPWAFLAVLGLAAVPGLLVLERLGEPAAVSSGA